MVNCQYCGKFANKIMTNNMADNEVAKRIKFLMKELNYRQVDFAQKIDVDTSNLSKYLNGRLAMSDALINKEPGSIETMARNWRGPALCQATTATVDYRA